MMNIKEELIQYCNSLGLDTIGFMRARVFTELKEFFTERQEKGFINQFEEQDIERKINPFFYMEDGKTIITVAFPYMYDKSFGDKVYFSKYTRGQDYHKVVRGYLQRLCDFIETKGGKAAALVDNNSLPERFMAEQSGLGFIGKNNMVITEKYGTYVFLGEIITDLDFEPNKILEKKCGDCDRCLKACPTKAIGENYNNPNICLSYITQKKELSEEEMIKLRGRLFGCDTCQRVCPFNQEIKFSEIPELKPYDFMDNPNLEELCNIDKGTFKKKYFLTSCGWRGKSVIQRNAMIAIFKQGKQDIIKAREITSPYVKEYYDRLLKLYKL